MRAYRLILEAQRCPQMLHGKVIFACGGGGIFCRPVFLSLSCIRMVSNVATDSAHLDRHSDLSEAMPSRSFDRMSRFCKSAFRTSLRRFFLPADGAVSLLRLAVEGDFREAVIVHSCPMSGPSKSGRQQEGFDASYVEELQYFCVGFPVLPFDLCAILC